MLLTKLLYWVFRLYFGVVAVAGALAIYLSSYNPLPLSKQLAGAFRRSGNQEDYEEYSTCSLPLLLN